MFINKKFLKICQDWFLQEQQHSYSKDPTFSLSYIKWLRYIENYDTLEKDTNWMDEILLPKINNIIRHD